MASSFNHQHMVFNSSVDDEFDMKIYSSSDQLFSPLMPSSSDGLILSKQFAINNQNWSSQQAAAPQYLSDQKASSAFSSGPQIISFGKSTNSSLLQLEDHMSLDDEMVCNRTRSITRNQLQAKYHVVSERKRRERLSELFISLSKIVPGLKKLDKASLLGDAIKYMKELQEQVKSLEEEVINTNSMLESDAHVEIRSNISSCDNDKSFIKENYFNGTNILPDIRIKISNRNLLVKIHCQKHNGFVAKIQSEMEKLHLTILDIRVIPFGCATLDITLLAQMEREFSTTRVKEIIEHLEIAMVLRPQYETLNNIVYNSEDYFQHLSPLSGSEAWP